VIALCLDLDGVANNSGEGTVRVHGRRIYDPANIGVLNSVLSETGCMLCITSAWRIGRSRDFLAGQLHTMGVRVCKPSQSIITPTDGSHRVVGITDCRGKSRGGQIRRWLDANRDLVERFAIVDDSHDAAELRPGVVDPELQAAFVQTTDAKGLTPEHGGRLIRLLRRGGEAGRARS